MKRFISYWLPGLFCSTLVWGDSDFLILTRRAERLFSENLYSDALPLYAQALELPADQTLKKQLTQRLAACYLKERRPEEAASLLRGWEDDSSRYLMSLIDRGLGEREKALETLKGCPESSHTHLELGEHLFQKGDYSSSKEAFSKISSQKGDPTPYALAQLYLAKIEALEGRCEKALCLLAPLSSYLPPDHPLLLEKNYLEGWVLLAQGDYSQAVSSLEKLPTAFRAEVLFLAGINHLKDKHYDLAAEAFALSNTPEAKKVQIIALVQNEKALEAWMILQELLETAPEEDLYYLSSWVALHLDSPSHWQKALADMEQVSPSERILKMTGLLSLRLQDWEKSDQIFASMINDFPASASIGDYQFWLAYSAEKQNREELRKERLYQVFTDSPNSPYAAAAYFQYYPYREYMHGTKKAIKHLQAMPSLFPSHPLLITAHYLLGLYSKKDVLSEEGQVARRKDLTAAIEAFQLSENLFEALASNMSSEDLAYYLQVRCLSQLERGKANFAIAQASLEGKKQIYLEYAETIFKDLIRQSPLSSKVQAEAELKLAQLLIEKESLDPANKILDEAIHHYPQKSYGMMAVWREKGKIAVLQNKFAIALQSFIKAEAASEEGLLSPDEKLDLWIQQSLCHQKLGQLDQAMLLLSRVINDDVISSLRIKAMFLRAGIYEQQGRPELALKQLESVSLKGGEWAKKAKEKLEKHYGY